MSDQLSVARKNGQKEPSGSHSPTATRRPTFDIEWFAPYLMNFIGGQWAKRFIPNLQDSPVTFTGWRVLVTIHHFGTGPLTEIATFANLDISTMSRVIDDLEKKGMVVRIEKQRKGRAIPVALTPAGSLLIKKMLPHALAQETAVLTRLSARERATLVRLLRKVVSDPTTGK